MDDSTLTMLKEAVQKALSEGKSMDEVKGFMQKTGYSEAEIGEVFSGVEAKPTTQAPAPGTKLCPRCGVPVGQSETFCPNCGARTDGAQQAAKPAVAQPSPQPKPAGPGFVSKLNFKIIGIVGIVCVLMVVSAFMLRGGAPAAGGPSVAPPSQPGQPSGLPTAGPAGAASAGLPPLDAYTKEFFTNYTTQLTTALGVSGDPFSLDSGSKAKLSAIAAAADSSGPVVIFNGQVYNGVEVSKEGTTYYLKPKGSTRAQDKIELISSESVTSEELLESIGDEIQSHIVKLFYDNLGKYSSNEAAYSGLNSQLKSYLDSAVSSGTLKSYTIDAVTDSILLTYLDDEMPFEVQPYFLAGLVKFVVDAYSDAAGYASGVADNYRQRLSNGEVLVVNTETEPQTADFLSKGALKTDVNPLVSAQSKDAALTSIAGNVRFSSATSGGLQTPTGGAVLGSSSDIQSLLDRPGTIVPLTKSVTYLEGPNHEVSCEILRKMGKSLPLRCSPISVLNQADGPLGTFLANDYVVNPVLTQWNAENVANIVRIINNPDISVLFWLTHGGYEGLEAEVWVLGPLGTAEFKANRKRFNERGDALRAEYGEKTVRNPAKLIPLDEEDLALVRSMPDAPQVLKDLIRANNTYGAIWVYGDFFRNNFKKRALFMLLACHGGSLAELTKSRVMLAANPDRTTQVRPFVSDLSEIDKYLYKLRYLDLQIETEANMRSYDVLLSASFKKRSLEETALYKCITSSKDGLCTINYFSTLGQTVSVSPHVKSASGDRIEFNAPMDSSKLPETIITIDASKCSGVSQESLSQKPEWDSSDGYGDKIIKLRWKGKVYRDWQGSDFEGGFLNNKDYAIITVSHANAVSKLSGVQLTGNPECCVAAGCSELSYYQKPATVECNGNRPKSDFVFMMPCLGSYYEACDESTTPKYAKISPKDGQQAPDYIKVGGKSYKSAALTDAQKKQAQSVQDWVAATAEEAKCDYNYYKSCGQTGQSEVIKVSPKGQGVSPPMYIKVSGKCYAFTYPTAAEKASAKQAEGWQEGTNCEQQCCPKDFSCKITYHETLGSPPLAVDLPYYFKYSKGELRINFNTAELAASLGDTTGNFGEGFISAGVPACGGASVKAEALLCITMQGRKGCLIMDLASMAAYSQGTETLDAFSSRTNLNITESKTIAGLPVICFTKEYPYLYHACVSIDERCPLTMSYDIESSQGLASMVATDVQFGIPDSQFEPQNVVCSVKLAGTGETAIADAMKKLIECMFPDLASFSGG